MEELKHRTDQKITEEKEHGGNGENAPTAGKRDTIEEDLKEEWDQGEEEDTWDGQAGYKLKYSKKKNKNKKIKPGIKQKGEDTITCKERGCA